MVMDSMIAIPPSGVWRGEVTRLALTPEGACGERTTARPLTRESITAVLFFDEDRLAGHAAIREGQVRLAGWWGPSIRHRPPILDLVEAHLWESGPVGLQFTGFSNDGEEKFTAWLHDNEITGYGRLDGP